MWSREPHQHAHATPMHHAAWNGDIPTLKCLLSHGASKDMRDTLWRATPRQWAEHAGQQAATDYLAALPLDEIR